MTPGNPRLTKVPKPAAGSLDHTAAALLTSASELLDGTNRWEQVWGKLLVAGFEPQAIGSALARLQHAGEVQEGLEQNGDAPKDPGTLAQMALLGQLAAQEGMIAESEAPGLAGRRLQKTLSTSEILLVGPSHDVTAGLQKMLEQVGVARTQTWIAINPLPAGEATAAQQRVIDDEAARLSRSASALMICATRGGNRQLSEMVNRASVANGVPAIYYHSQGLQVQAGPLVIPRQTACYACYKVRREATLAPWERSLLAAADESGQMACLLGADWITMDAVKLLCGFGEPVTRGRVLFIDYYAGLPEVHTLLRLPRCTVCGNPKRPPVRLWEESE
jgi:bacteriocin biosynthesis cyclodehydratase domain-containing protein